MSTVVDVVVVVRTMFIHTFNGTSFFLVDRRDGGYSMWNIRFFDFKRHFFGQLNRAWRFLFTSSEAKSNEHERKRWRRRSLLNNDYTYTLYIRYSSMFLHSWCYEQDWWTRAEEGGDRSVLFPFVEWYEVRSSHGLSALFYIIERRKRWADGRGARARVKSNVDRCLHGNVMYIVSRRSSEHLTMWKKHQSSFSSLGLALGNLRDSLLHRSNNARHLKL